MRHNSALVKNLILSTAAMLALSLASARSGAQVVFDGLDWTTDRGGILVDAGTRNLFPQRQGFNAVGPAGAPDQRLDAHRGQLRWAFPRIDDLSGVDVSVTAPGTTIIVDNPVPLSPTNSNSRWDKSDTTIFYDSSQPFTSGFVYGPNYFAPLPGHTPSPYDTKTQWLPQGGPTFVIPDPIYRTGYSGFSFTFTPSDPTVANDPFANNPPAAVQNDYGITAAVHNDFLVDRGGKFPASPATAAELSQFPVADPAVYRAVHNVLVNEYNTQAHPIAIWTIGQTLNNNFDTFDVNGNAIQQPVPNDPDTPQPPPPAPAIPPKLPSQRIKKFTVDLYSPGDGTQILDATNTALSHPNAQTVFVRVSWQSTINADGTINKGAGTPNTGGINDPVNSRIYIVDLSQPGWIHLGAPNTSPASFPSGGTNTDGTRNEIVVTLFSLTPDNVTDTNVYSQFPLVTADACRFIEQDQPALPNPDPNVHILANGLGPLNDPLNQDPNNRLFTFIGQSGRFLGPVAGTNKFTTDPALDAVPNGIYKTNSTLWYCVREEIVPNQARINQDPTQVPNATTNPLIIDPAATGTAPVFYCLTNENNVITPANTTLVPPTPAVVTQSKMRVVWRYVGYPDGGSATSFTSPTFANVKARDGKFHPMVYFCGTSNTELSGSAGRIYALDALGDINTLPYNPSISNDPASFIDQKYDNAKHQTTTKAYWTYPSIRPLEKEEILMPVGTLAGTNTFANQYHDPNYTQANLTDPEGLYPQNNPAQYGMPGFWWAADQSLFGTGSKQYYDGDLVTQSGNIVAKSDTQIQMGGISGAPIVITDPSNPTGPMVLVVPSLDGRLYAFDAGGRGDFDTTKALPTPPVDPNNPNVPPGTPLTLGINYAIPGTTQRLWTWPHWSADAFHQTYDMVGSTANAGVANVFQSEASKGYMPYSPAYDEPFGPADARNPLIVSAGTPGQEGLPGAGHVYGVLPLHDAPVYIGQNNVPNWTVPVTIAGLAGGTTDRRYWAWPFENNGRANDPPSATPLLDIPSVPTIFQSSGSTGTNNRFVYFTSGGRIYSLALPNQAPNGGHYTPPLNWVLPHTPDTFIPNQDPTDPTTFAYTQGFAAKGLAVIPAALLGKNSVTNTTTDQVFALLTDGTLLSMEANPTTRPTVHETNFIASNITLTGSFTESAPTLVELERDPFLDARGRVFDPNTGQLIQTTSVPTIVFADDSGQTYGYETNPNTYPDGNGNGGTITILPLIYEGGLINAQIATPVALAASTRQLPIGAVPPSDAQGHPLIAQPYFGGYFAAGGTNGQLYAYSVGRFVNGFGDTGGNDTGAQGGGRGLVSIDIREADAYTNYAANPPAGYKITEFDRIAPTRGQAANGLTPGRREDGTKYDKTATPIAGNIPESGSNVGIALDQGGNLYLAASGVYHAQAQDPNQKEYGTDIPTIRVTFNISQNGLPLETQTQTLTPVTINPNNKGRFANQPWPDDLAIISGDKANLHIFGVDDNNPSGMVNPYGDGTAPQKLTGPAQNVYPWVAKKLVQIIPRNVGGGTTFGPSSTGYTVSVTAEIEQHVHTANSGNQPAILARAQANTLRLGQRYDQGLSQSEFPPDVNNPAVSQSPQRSLYITNPLSLTVRSYNNLNDMTGAGPLDNPNMIGWAGAIDNPNVQNGKFTNALELVGNGAFVGIGSPRPGTRVGGNVAGNVGYVKPVFAPFGMAQDNSSAPYQIDNNGAKQPGVFLMDRSDLERVTGHKVHVRARISPLNWVGGPSSVMNPLPFDQLPDAATHSVDYPPLDAQSARLSVNNVDITQSVAPLTPPTNNTNDPSQRQVHPTQVDFAVQIPKYMPANVNRGQTSVNFRGKNIYVGDAFSDMAGYAKGYNGGGAAGLAASGSVDKNPIVGPLDLQTGVPLPQTGGKGGSPGSGSKPGASGSLAGSSPSGGYIGNVTVIVVPPGANNAGSGALGGRGRGGSAGLGGFFQSSNSGQIDRIFQTGVSVAPAIRMRVLEDTLDMGNVPHGTGYSDLVGGKYYYRYPFAPSGTGYYQSPPSVGNPNGQILFSPWDNDGQFSLPNTPNGLPNLGTPPNNPVLGRFFRPFTLVNDSNLNLDKLRVAKMFGPHSNDTSANPDLSGIVNNYSLSVNPGNGLANSVRLNSDQVNNLLSPPLFALPFGQQAPGGGAGDTGFLGNIGLVTSYDHDSYAQSRISEVNLYPMLNPAVDANAAQQARDLYSLGLISQDLYAKGAGLPWAVGIQGRPTVHKPRPGDSNGSLATVPDQPYDYQAAAQNNNPNNQGFYQQEVKAGLFNRPAAAIAVPMGTPVGTYTAKILPFEDGMPIQWLEWLSSSDPNLNSPTHTQYLGNEDDILNTNLAGAPTEPYASTAPTLKVTVRESRLTNGVTTGVMPQIDLRNLNSGDYDPIGFNLQPSAFMVPGPVSGNDFFNKIMLYWTTNRVPANSQFGTNVNGVTLPNPIAPLNIAYSSLYTPYANLNGYNRGDAQFAGPVVKDNTNNPLSLPQWWKPLNLLPGFSNPNTPNNYKSLFDPNNSIPNINPATVRYGSPATTIATRYIVGGGFDVRDIESYLFTQGTADFLPGQNAGVSAAGINAGQQTVNRTFYSTLSNSSGSSVVGEPDFGEPGAINGLLSFKNDPRLPKLSPRPLLVKIQTGNGDTGVKYLYVFWHSGSQGRTSLYYNVNIQAQGLGVKFPPGGFEVLGDQKLPSPAALTWQSDPYPVFRRAFDPTTNQMVNAIDLMFTGVLKSRQNVEVLMARYRIVDTPVPANGSQPALLPGQLVAIPFPTVHLDQLKQVNGTNTWAGRDAAWFLPSDTQTSDTAANRFLRVYLQPRTVNGVTQQYLLNGLNNKAGAQRGRVDTASGLVYFNAVASDGAGNIANNPSTNRPVYGGGQIVVDSQSGTVTFPNIPPGKQDTVYASYTPYIMRVNTARNDSNIDRDVSDLWQSNGGPLANGTTSYGNFQALLTPHGLTDSPGQNYAPTTVMDRAANLRSTFQSPQVMFAPNNTPINAFDKNGNLTNGTTLPIDRLWALYRQSDPSNSKNSTVYMKAMRLTAKLPRPVALAAVNGTATSPLAKQKIASLAVERYDPVANAFVPLRSGYEVDWVRGRVYFQEEDEGDIVHIRYTFFDPSNNKTDDSGDLFYRVAWADEINSGGHPYDGTSANKFTGDETTPEVQMPTSSYINEGQVAAFKDPYIDKLWVFWSSTRAGAVLQTGAQNPPKIGTTDLYYETLAPQFYPRASNQY